MKKIFLFYLATSCYITLIAQGVAINTDGSSPHPSAMLDIKSGTKGLLMPRTSTASRLAILNPPTGLTLYDSSIGSFWFQNAGLWIESGRIDPVNGNSFFGFQSGRTLPTGDFNSGFGAEALYSITTGIGNTSIGNGTMHSNTIGNYNTTSGAYSLYFNTTGSYNTAIGTSAMILNQTGSNNVAVGSAALFHETSGSYSVAIGDSALFMNQLQKNTAVGSKALFHNQGGFNNTAVGIQTLFYNSTGYQNTAIGDLALLNNTTGINNVGIGISSLQNNTGDLNTGVGANTSITQGSGNTVIGNGAYTDGNISNAIAIGIFGRVSCSNCLALGASNPTYRIKVGINNATPVTDLHIIQQTDATFDNSRGIRLQRPNGNQWRVFLDPGSNYVFQYNNSLFSYIEPAGGTFINNSDERLKRDISSLDHVMDKLMLLQPKTYHYIASNDDSRHSWGFLAQDVEKLFPDFVFSSENGIKGIAYSNFSVIAIKAIQEQQQQIEDQKQKVDQQLQQIGEQKQRIDQQQQQIDEMLKEMSYLRKKINQ